MANLEKVFYVEGTALYMDKGTNVPPWYPNWKNIDNWYFEDGISYCYNLVNNNDLYVQYGRDDVGWASARFFSNTVEILNEIENGDGSINATVRVQTHFFNGRPNNNPVTGYATNYKVTVNDVVQYEFSGNSRDEFENGERPAITFDIIVPPQETNTQTTFRLSFEYPNGEVPDSYLHVGIGLFNPNELSYKPMAIRKNNNWNDFDSNSNAKILRRVNGSWIDKSEEKVNTSRQVDEGKNRLRVNGEWRQLPKMTGGIAP